MGCTQTPGRHLDPLSPPVTPNPQGPPCTAAPAPAHGPQVPGVRPCPRSSFLVQPVIGSRHHSSALHTRAALVPKAARRRGGSTGLRMRLLAQGLTHGPHPQLPAGSQGFLSPPPAEWTCLQHTHFSLPTLPHPSLRTRTVRLPPADPGCLAHRHSPDCPAGAAPQGGRKDGDTAQPEPVRGDTRCCQQRETPVLSPFGFIRSRFFLEMNSEQQKLSQRSHTRLS